MEDGGAAPAAATHSRAAGPMRPQFLPTAVEPDGKWQVWYRMFKDHTIAQCRDTIAEALRLAILRTSLGAEGYRIFVDLCPEPDLCFVRTVERLTSPVCVSLLASWQDRIFRDEPNRQVRIRNSSSQPFER